ncbi:unnamed protein product [Closterium sp. NIES-53]
MCRSFGSEVPSLLSTICLRASSLRALFGACSLAFLPTHRTGSFTTWDLVVCCRPATSILARQSASTVFHPHRSSPVPLPPLSLVVDPPSVAPLPPPSPAPSGVSQVDPPPLVEPLEVSSDTSGPAEGGDPTVGDTMAPRRSARLAVPPSFPPRLSSSPQQPVVVDFGATRGGDTWGADSGGAACPTGTGAAGGAAVGGAGAGGSGARRQETLSPERLREWAVQWGSPGGGAGRAGAGSPGGTGTGGASAGVPRAGRAGGTGAGGTGAVGGTGGTGVVGAVAGSTGSCWQEPLSPEWLREWAVRWGSPGGGAGRTGAGGTGGTGPRGASAAGLGFGGADTGSADTGGATGGTGVGGASWQESLSPHLPPAVTEFPVAGTTPPLLFPPPDQSQPQLLPHSPPPTPAPYTVVTESLSESREPASRPLTPVRTRRAVRPRPPPVPGTHIMALRPSSVPQRVVLPSPPASSLPHVLDLESDLCPYCQSNFAELVDFAVLCRLDYAGSLVFESSCPPSVKGELALGCDVLEDWQFELECLAATAPHLASTLLCPEGDPDALYFLTSRSNADAITDPPPGAIIVDDMWIFRVKRPLGSPPAFKARYVA